MNAPEPTTEGGTRARGESPYKHVRSLDRGLAVLNAIAMDGEASVSDISYMTRLPRSTVYRVLQTLESLGYVRRNIKQPVFRLTSRVRFLSANLANGNLLSDLAAPMLHKLVREVLWPSSLAVFDHNAMRIVETTHHLSPYSIHHNAVGTRLPLLTTAMGRAHVCFCRQVDLDAIFENLASLYDAATLDQHRRRIADLRSQAARTGYAYSNGDTDPRFLSFALPIWHDNTLIAATNLIFFRKSIKLDHALELYLEPLRRTVREIEAKLQSHSVSVDAPWPKPFGEDPEKGELPSIRRMSAVRLPPED